MNTKLLPPLYAFLLAPLLAFGQTTLNNPTPGGGATLQEFILLLVDIIQLIGMPILVVCLIYGGFLFVSASGNEDQLTKAKMWVLWSIVGATIILGARVIANVVFGTASLF